MIYAAGVESRPRMQVIVHFAVGLAGGLLVLLFVDWEQPREFLFIFGNGVWAMLPDGHWMLSAFGVDGPAAVPPVCSSASSSIPTSWFRLNEYRCPWLSWAISARMR